MLVSKNVDFSTPPIFNFEKSTRFRQCKKRLIDAIGIVLGQHVELSRVQTKVYFSAKSIKNAPK